MYRLAQQVRETDPKQVVRDEEAAQSSKEQKRTSSTTSKTTTKSRVPSFKSVLSQPKKPKPATRRDKNAPPLATRGTTPDEHRQKRQSDKPPVTAHAATESKQVARVRSVVPVSFFACPRN